MEIVFFIYGLCFFVLGLSILLYPKKGSGFKLATHLYLIAGFGLAHGINEWLDMFILIQKAGPTLFLELIRMVTLPGSFLFLVLFGAKVVAEARPRLGSLQVLPVVLIAAWSIIFITSKQRFLMGDIWARYLLCAPGAILTAYGLILYLPQIQKTRLPMVIQNLKLGSVTFFFYGLIAGAIVPKADFFPASLLNYDIVRQAFGVPIQIFRAICALILAYSTLRVLSVFHWETQNTLRESDLRFRSIANTAPIILFLADRDGAITFVEGRALTTLGIKPIQLVGKPVLQLFGSTPQVKENIRQVLAGEECFSTLTVKEVAFEISYSPVRHRGDEITGLIGVALDITQRKHAQAELDKFRDEMVKTRRLAELGTMSAGMTQELDEPVNVTRLLLERLLTDIRRSPQSEALAETVKKSFSEITKASSILDKFCRCAQLSPRTEAEPIDLYQVVKRVIAVFADKAQRVNLNLIAKGVDVVLSMYISERELEQTLFILVQKAIDAADSAKAEKLTISCRVKDKQMELVFADNCWGIPGEDLKNIFQPFFTTKPDSEEAGLGFAVVNRIVTNYGGSINVESEQVKGTTFHITLPVERVY